MENPKPRISVQGSARIRQRPSFLMMTGTLEASDATLELALAGLRKRIDAASKWLDRLNAESVEFGEPRFPDQVEQNPMQMARRRMGVPASADNNDDQKNIMVSYTAMWPIDGMDSEKVLIFADRLKFETADLSGPETESKDEIAEFTPDSLGIDQIQSIMSASLGAADDDKEPHFLFVSRLSEERYEQGLKEALEDANTRATSIARAAGKVIRSVETISCYSADNVSAAANIQRIHRQSMSPTLSETSHGTGQNEIVSESPRSVEFSVSISASYTIE